MSGDARDKFASFIPDGDVARFATGLPAALRGDFAGTMGLRRRGSMKEAGLRSSPHQTKLVR